MYKKLLVAALCGFLTAQAWALETFKIKDIRVEGLQRIAAGTVFNYLPVQIGEEMSEQRTADVIRALFKTGFFQDVSLARDADVLVVSVVERPSVSVITITGNKSLEDEQLRKGLADIGLAEGRTYDRSMLDKVEQQLQRLYYSQGKYGVRMETTVTPLERNRVGIKLEISEGKAAKIHRIHIVGNHAFEDDELLEEFELGTPPWYSFFSSIDQYSKQKLAGDLETLRSWYLNRGYINFNIESTQVSITPDKKNVYITINVREGEKFSIGKVKLAGELVLEKEDLFKLVRIHSGDTFSRRKATRVSNAITERLGQQGYAFANVNLIPEVDEKEKRVDLTFFVDPGKRVYVRRINYEGNTRTRDAVLRREMRQMESAWIATDQVERSRVRLNRLGFFEDVTVETPAVSGSSDQVDVNFKVTEKASGNLVAGIGYTDAQGVIFNLSVTQDNFLGSGKRVALAFDNSEFNTVYRFSYTNPYYTVDGVSRGFNMLFRETDAGAVNIARYTTDEGLLSIDYGIPFTEYNYASFGIGLSDITVHSSDTTPTAYQQDLDTYGNGFTGILVKGRLSHDTRNRRIFPTRGAMQSLSVEAQLPGSDWEYYKIRYRHQRFFEMTKDLTLAFDAEIGYGDGYGEQKRLPFFENFFAGGSRSVRGFDENTLGARDAESDDPLGGNAMLAGSLEVLFPIPWVKDANAWRFAGFVDFGNVFSDDYDTPFELSELRYSAGLGVSWVSPLGLLTFSFAEPLNEKAGDEVKRFQFSFGTGF